MAGSNSSVMAVAQMHHQQQAQQQMAAAAAASNNSANLPPIATQCFMLSNMFDPQNESEPNWDAEIREDVIEECNKHGGVSHIYVDKARTQESLDT